MKKFLGFLFVLIFSTNISLADDISDFQIEGMSIGDSLLDYFSESEIKNTEKIIYPASDKFYQIELKAQKESNYDKLSFILKKNDNLYKIFLVGGGKFFENDLKSRPIETGTRNTTKSSLNPTRLCVSFSYLPPFGKTHTNILTCSFGS